MIYFFVPAVIDICRKHGLEPRVVYDADGIRTWGVDAPEGHPLLKDPDFVECLIGGIMQFGALLARRLKPPLFFPKKDGQVAHTFDEEGKECIVLARRRDTLEFMLTNPATGKSPELLCVNGRIKLLRVFQRAEKVGVTKIIYFVAPKISETIKLKDAIALTTMVLEGRVGEPTGTGSAPSGDA
jgi:hypothetical protein